MCLGIPGRIVSLEAGHPDLAIADVSGAEKPINLGIIDEPIEVGSWVVIHMGFALETISAEEAEDALAVLDTLGPNAAEGLDMGAPPPW